MERDSNYSEENRLQTLSGSNYEVADNEPDIRGWTINDQNGKKIGEVDDLIFDPQSRQVRYLVVDMEDNLLDVEPRDVLVPVGIAELHESDDTVILPGVNADHLRAVPVFDKERIDRDTETKVISAYSGVSGVNAKAEGDFYNQEHFNEEKAYKNRPIPVIKEELQVGKKEVETGGARVRTRIVEKPVQENVTLREEHVNVERKPVNRPVSDADVKAFKEGEIEITERAEVPVVGKEARVVEEISLNKEVTQREETIKGTVHNTEVKVENLDKDKNPNQNMPPNTDPNNPNNPNRS